MSTSDSKYSIELKRLAEEAHKKAEAKKREQLINDQALLKFQNDQQRMAEDRQKREKHLNKYLAHITETVENRDRRVDNVYTANVASMLMDSEPRLKALANVFVALFYKAMQGFFDKFSEEMQKASPEWFAGLVWGPPVLSTKFMHGVKSLFEQKKPFSMPDLKYFVSVNPDGEIAQLWGPVITNLFQEPYPDPKTPAEIQENSEVQAAKGAFLLQLQTAVESWLASNDCQVVMHNGKRKVYRNDSLDKNPHGDTWAPKSGHEDNFMKEDEFVALRDNTAFPEKSLGHYMDDYFSGLKLEFEEDPNVRRGMTP